MHCFHGGSVHGTIALMEASATPRRRGSQCDQYLLWGVRDGTMLGPWINRKLPTVVGLTPSNDRVHQRCVFTAAADVNLHELDAQLLLWRRVGHQCKAHTERAEERICAVVEVAVIPHTVPAIVLHYITPALGVGSIPTWPVNIMNNTTYCWRRSTMNEHVVGVALCIDIWARGSD
eukprot:m.389159 g.389159  ORF g.389159 m.389159 type:complete len:176 (-) comp21048_c0_seq2:21-548(-)